MRAQLKSYKDLAYNTYNMLKEYHTYEEILWMPLRNLMDTIEEFRPRFKAIAQRQAQEKLRQELEQKKNAARQAQLQRQSNRRNNR